MLLCAHAIRYRQLIWFINWMELDALLFIHLLIHSTRSFSMFYLSQKYLLPERCTNPPTYLVFVQKNIGRTKRAMNRAKNDFQFQFALFLLQFLQLNQVNKSTVSNIIQQMNLSQLLVSSPYKIRKPQKYALRLRPCTFQRARQYLDV